MKKLLLGKHALVTGGARGIGKAIAKKYAEEGASLALFGTNAAKGEEAVRELQEIVGEKGKVIFYTVDIAEGKQIEEAIGKVLADFGTIDILVNNAGITRDNLLLKLSPEDWDVVLNTNLRSVYYICRALVRSMIKARQGKIINISSVVGLIGNAGQTNYAASKAGMIGFTKSLAKEVGSRNICVNCIAPGYIQTDMTEGLSEGIKEKLLAEIPLQKLGNPEDIAHAALFLASSHADYITGQVLTVDGGMAI